MSEHPHAPPPASGALPANLTFPNPLVQIQAKRSGVVPVQLLDVLALDGTSYHWASASIVIPAILTGTPPQWNALQGRIANWDGTYLPWLIAAGPFHMARSMQADIGNFTVQNVSGNTIQRDVSTLLTSDAFEGALFVYREYNVEANAVEFEFHGRLSILQVNEMQAESAAEQLFNSNNYAAPADVYSETCPWHYASAQCGATDPVPCNHTFTTCKVPTPGTRFGGILNTYQHNVAPTVADVSLTTVERRRPV